MRRCPACGTTYTDETLRFCLADGSPLSDADEQATVVSGPGAGQIRVDIPPDTRGAAPPQPLVQNAGSAGSGGGLKIFAVVAIVLILLGGLVVIAGGLFYYSRSRSEQIASTNSSNRGSPSPSTSPAANDQDELRNQIANLTKQLNEQKNANRPANITLPSVPNPPSTTSARVNSPGDGFLALRSLPSSEIGERLVKIPHGATISIGGCGPVVKPVNRPGRWCQANYNGYSGWVFDAYLIY